MANNLKKKIVMLILTENCNLACTYCYEHNKTERRMSFETAKKIIDTELTKDDGYEEVEIDFFGGEPFLEFKLIKQVHEYIYSHQWSKKVLCFTTTNGTLVHGEIRDWLEKNKDTMWVSLSLDGTREMHNTNRCNSYDDIDIEFFRDTWPQQSCKATISKETLPDLAKGVFELKNKGFLAAVTMAQGIEWEEENLKTLEEQLQILVNYYIEHPEEPICYLLDISLEGLVGWENEPVKWCGTGEGMITYDVNGNFYPCQAFAPQSLGKESEKYKNTTLERFSEGFDDENCKSCIVYPICRTCYGTNNLVSGDYKKRDMTMCKFNKMCILASAYIKYHRYSAKNIDELTDSEIIELHAIQKVQNLEV